MKVRLLAVLSVLAVMGFSLAGCGDKPAETTDTAAPGATAATTGTTPAATNAATAGFPKGTVKVGDKALCVVCAVKEGTTAAEDVKATLDYKDRTYAFCNDAEKAEFISNPAKYAQAK